MFFEGEKLLLDFNFGSFGSVETLGANEFDLFAGEVSSVVGGTLLLSLLAFKGLRIDKALESFFVLVGHSVDCCEICEEVEVAEDVLAVRSLLETNGDFELRKKVSVAEQL